MNERKRGLAAYEMPQEVCGPTDRYAVVMRYHPEKGTQLMMVHYEGVGYLVDAEHPWKWNDYGEDAQQWALDELLDLIEEDAEVDLADWVRSFGARLESNFWLVVRWIEGA